MSAAFISCFQAEDKFGKTTEPISTDGSVSIKFIYKDAIIDYSKREYQREQVADLEFKQGILVTVLDGGHKKIPQIHIRVIKVRTEDATYFTYELVDGQQRVTSVTGFLNGDFELPKPLILSDGRDIGGYTAKQLEKKYPSIMKAIGRQGGSFRTSLVRKRANEDAPTVHTGPAIAGTGDDSSTVVVRKKKKKKGILIGGDKPMNRLDGRTKAYKLHAQRLQAQRERRQKLKDSKSDKFTKGLKEKFNDFSREEFIVEDNVAILRDIVKRKQAKPIKLKDGQMKVDGYTASAMVQTLDNKKMKPDTKKKLEFIINKGTKSQFLRTVDAVFK